MGTAHTGIPMMLRNIQPPPIPVCGLRIVKVVLNGVGDQVVDVTTFYISISADNGYSVSGVPIQYSSYLFWEATQLQYGHYVVTEAAKDGYVNQSITPSEFDLSADNPFQIVTITNVIALGVVTVTKVITGVTEDETYFDITITGQGADPIEQFGQVRLGEPLTFYDLPFDEYIVTEADTEGYTLTSILPASVTVDSSTYSGEVTVTNEVAQALEMTFKVIDEVVQWPVADAESVSDWNTFFDLPTNGTEFSSVEVVGNVVKLYGGGGITLKDNLFQSNINIVSFLDKNSVVIAAGASSFNQCGITDYLLPVLASAGDGCFGGCLATSLILPSLLEAPYFCFESAEATSIFEMESLTLMGISMGNCVSMTELYIPSCNNIGDTVGLTNVFTGITGQPITLTIPAALMTCNGGDPDGDIQYLVANNTVTLITV